MSVFFLYRHWLSIANASRATSSEKKFADDDAEDQHSNQVGNGGLRGKRRRIDRQRWCGHAWRGLRSWRRWCLVRWCDASYLAQSDTLVLRTRHTHIFTPHHSTLYTVQLYLQQCRHLPTFSSRPCTVCSYYQLVFLDYQEALVLCG